MFKYKNQSIEVLYETGYHFRIDYLSENTLKWTALAKREDGGALMGEETFYYHVQTEDIITINWIENTGLCVSQNLDFKAKEVYAFMTWGDESKHGKRGFLAHKGTIKIL